MTFGTNIRNPGLSTHTTYRGLYDEENRKRSKVQIFTDISDMAHFTPYRYNDWETLRRRRIDWRCIPKDCCARVIPFFPVRDVLSLDSAMSDKPLRQDLQISYKNAVLSAFDKHRYTNKDDFKGLRWVMRVGISLQACNVVIVNEMRRTISDTSKVLEWLVRKGLKDLATM